MGGLGCWASGVSHLASNVNTKIAHSIANNISFKILLILKVSSLEVLFNMSGFSFLKKKKD